MRFTKITSAEGLRYNLVLIGEDYRLAHIIGPYDIDIDPIPETNCNIGKYVKYFGDHFAIIIFCYFQRH